MASLCLNMIVKNESHVIKETLQCICKYFNLDYWVISDTGSSDNTVEIIEDFFREKNIKGEIHHHEWQDFAYNRNKALECCKDKADYVLFFDADDLMEGDFTLPPLVHDAYYLKFREEDIDVHYTRCSIIKNNQKIFWKGVLHELIVHDESAETIFLNGDYSIISRHVGARNLDPNRSLNDARVLEEGFENETDPLFQARYAFYAAQSYAGHFLEYGEYADKAIEWYKKRISFTFSFAIDDEKYSSYEYLGMIYAKQDNIEQALYYWEEATYFDPDRAECWYHIAKYHNWAGNLDLAYKYIKQGVYLPIPEGVRLFITTSIYDFRCLYELCLITWKMRKLSESYAAFKKLVIHLPAEELSTLTHVVKSFKSLIQQDKEAEVIELKKNLAKLGHPDYLEKLDSPTLCLNMIVKNEKHVIQQTLECLCRYIDFDYWVISDTGSTDNTVQIIEDFFAKKGITGEIHRHEWKDFAYNRNKALEACEGKADYVMFFDADDLIEGYFSLPPLTHDGYYLKFKEEDETAHYARCLIIKNNQKSYWKGVLHEILIHSEDMDIPYVTGNYSIVSRHIGDRNKDPKKLIKDALLLEQAFYDETDPEFLSRYAFYCAKSYFGASLTDKKYINNAIEWFLKRMEFTEEGIDDEKYISYELAGTLYVKKKKIQEALDIWKKGTEHDPKRAECWYRLMCQTHKLGRLEEAYRYAEKCVDLPVPEGLRGFINYPIYKFGCLYEMCHISWKLNKIDESYSIFKKLLPNLPPHLIYNFNSVVGSYAALIKQDSPENIKQLKDALHKIGKPNYLREFGV